jgi:protein-tyrosine phosphatase
MTTNEIAKLFEARNKAFASEIFEGFLWLGSGRDAQNLDSLQEYKITHILNVADDVPNYFPDKFVYHNLHVADFGQDKGISRVFESAFKFVEEVKAHEGGRVLVHCAAGINRSATVVVALMMHFEPEATLADAFRKVLAKRRISPFRDNREQLLAWELKVRDGKSSMEEEDFSNFMLEAVGMRANKKND